MRLVGGRVAAVVRSAHVSIRLRHGRDAWDASAHGAHGLGHIIVVRLIVLRMVAALQHRGRILVCNCTLGSCQLLIFDEFLLSLSVATCTARRDIRIVSSVRLYLLLQVLVADGDHGAVWWVRTAVDALALLVHLRAATLRANEDDVALVDACVV